MTNISPSNSDRHVVMLSFWALLDESDIEAYVSTLLLPPYMSHLRRAPLRFETQPANSDGRQPLQITCLGDGRIEEFFIHPQKHALNLLRSLCPDMPPASIRINDSESIWIWTKESDRMKLYFEPTQATLDMDFPPRFDPRICHVSVSRKELFLGQAVLQSYFGTWLHRLEGKTEQKKIDLEIEMLGGGVRFQDEKLAGEYWLEDDPLFRDLLQYGGLNRTLRDLDGLVKLDLQNAEIETGPDGFRVHLGPATDDPRNG